MIRPNLAMQHLIPVHFQEGRSLFAVAVFAAAGIKKEKKKKGCVTFSARICLFQSTDRLAKLFR